MIYDLARVGRGCFGGAMARSVLFLAAWTLLAGAGIPLIGVLNGGMARAVGQAARRNGGDVRRRAGRRASIGVAQRAARRPGA